MEKSKLVKVGTFLLTNDWAMLGFAITLSLTVVLRESISNLLWFHWVKRLLVWELKAIAIMGGLLLLITIVKLIIAEKDDPRGEIVRDLRHFLILTIPLAMAWVIDSFSSTVLPLLTAIFGLYGTRLVIFCGTIGLGIAAHFWKRRDQFTYGMGEVAFAFLATAFIAFRLTPGQSILSQWVALGGGAYVVARGLNNMTDATKKGEALDQGSGNKYGVPLREL